MENSKRDRKREDNEQRVIEECEGGDESFEKEDRDEIRNVRISEERQDIRTEGSDTGRIQETKI